MTTIVGFATHGETELSFLPRFVAVFIPLAFAWFILAPWFGLFQPGIASDGKQIWRVPLVMIFAAPVAGLARGLILHSGVVIIIFVFVLGGTSALGVVIWRLIYFLFTRNKSG